MKKGIRPMELGNCENNIVLLNRFEYIEVEFEANNIVSMTHSADLHVVELDNVVELSSAVEDSSVKDAEPSGGSCSNGVCAVTWKPKRPTAA